MIQINLSIKQKQIHRHRKNAYDYQRGNDQGGINQEFGINRHCAVLCLVAQSCLTLCDPMDCSPPGSSVHGDSPGKNTGVGCHALLQEIVPTQGSNPGSSALQVDSLPLSHQGSPLGLQYSYTEVSSLSFLQGNFPTQESNQGLLHCRWILYQLSYQGIPIKSLCYTSETNVTLCVDCFSISSQYTFSINVSQCITL